MVGLMTSESLYIALEEVWWWSAAVTGLTLRLAASGRVLLACLAFWMVFVSSVTFIELSWIWVLAVVAFSSSVW